MSLARPRRTSPSIPTRRSSDLGGRGNEAEGRFLSGDCAVIQTSSGFYGNVAANAKFPFGMTELPYYPDIPGAPQNSIDRKSTRLNSSHLGISYAVFCLKKKSDR